MRGSKTGTQLLQCGMQLLPSKWITLLCTRCVVPWNSIIHVLYQVKVKAYSTAKNFLMGSSMCTWWKASSQSEVNFYVVGMLMLLHWMIILRNWHTVHNLNNMKTEEYRYGAFIYLLIIWSKNNVRKCITIYYVSIWKYMKYLSTILRRSIRWVNLHDIHQSKKSKL